MSEATEPVPSKPVRIPYAPHLSANERRIVRLENDLTRAKILLCAVVIKAGGRVEVDEALQKQLLDNGANYQAQPGEGVLVVEASVAEGKPVPEPA